MSESPIEILAEHAWYLVINKPCGVLTQAVPGVTSVQTSLVHQLQKRLPNGPTPFVGVPHRLDRMTTGAMVFARNQRALKRLCEQFAARKVKKIYHAWVPKLSEPTGRWSDFIRKVPNEPRAEVVTSETMDAKEAVLHYRTLASTLASVEHSASVPVDLVEIELETGRMHQIRLQFGSRGFPILGDQLYGSAIVWQEQAELREPPMALHARFISFYDPQTAECVEATAPYPSGWLDHGPA
jgi:23S rRNA pseudouridine1911/1915/1917 synthase